MRMHRLLASFKEASRGLAAVFRSEQNFRIQLCVSLIVIALGIFFRLKLYEFVIIFVLIGSVLAMELLNTALEYCTDLLKPRLNHYVKLIKETMAAAVLVTALTALGVGLLIFTPHFIDFVK